MSAKAFNGVSVSYKTNQRSFSIQN